MKKKKIAIVLFVLQGIALVMVLTDGSLASLFATAGAGYAGGYLMGFFLPTIIGVILLNKAKKEQAKS